MHRWQKWWRCKILHGGLALFPWILNKTAWLTICLVHPSAIAILLHLSMEVFSIQLLLLRNRDGNSWHCVSKSSSLEMWLNKERLSINSASSILAAAIRWRWPSSNQAFKFNPPALTIYGNCDVPMDVTWLRFKIRSCFKELFQFSCCSVMILKWVISQCIESNLQTNT